MKELNINVERTGFPITIQGIEFFFDASLEGLERYHSKYDEIIKDIQNMTETEDYIEDRKIILKKSYDSILGDGCFEKLYAKIPDVVAWHTVFFEIVNGIDERTTEFLKDYDDKSQQILKLYEDKKAEMRG